MVATVALTLSFATMNVKTNVVLTLC
jgi:hypothetical protein